MHFSVFSIHEQAQEVQTSKGVCLISFSVLIYMPKHKHSWRPLSSLAGRPPDSAVAPVLQFSGQFPSPKDCYDSLKDFYRAIQVFLNDNAPHQHLEQAAYTPAMIQDIVLFEERVAERNVTWFENCASPTDLQKKVYDRLLSRNMQVLQEMADYYPNGRVPCFKCGSKEGSSPSKDWLYNPSPRPCFNEDCRAEWVRIYG